jgi:hypothetical protein
MNIQAFATIATTGMSWALLVHAESKPGDTQPATQAK